MPEIVPIESDEGARFLRVKWSTLVDRISRRGVYVPAGTERDCIAFANPANVFVPKRAPPTAPKKCLRFRLVTAAILADTAYKQKQTADGALIKPRWMTAEWAPNTVPDITLIPGNDKLPEDFDDWPPHPALDAAETLNADDNDSDDSDDDEEAPGNGIYNPQNDFDNNDDDAAWDEAFAPVVPRPRVGARELESLGPIQRGPRRPRRSARIANRQRGTR